MGLQFGRAVLTLVFVLTFRCCWYSKRSLSVNMCGVNVLWLSEFIVKYKILQKTQDHSYLFPLKSPSRLLQQNAFFWETNDTTAFKQMRKRPLRQYCPRPALFKTLWFGWSEFYGMIWILILTMRPVTDDAMCIKFSIEFVKFSYATCYGLDDVDFGWGFWLWWWWWWWLVVRLGFLRWKCFFEIENVLYLWWWFHHEIMTVLRQRCFGCVKDLI